MKRHPPQREADYIDHAISLKVLDCFATAYVLWSEQYTFDMLLQEKVWLGNLTLPHYERYFYCIWHHRHS